VEPRTARVKVDGIDSEVVFDVHAAHDRFVSDEIVGLGTWEPLETDVVRRLLDPGVLFLDAGANLGWYTVLAALWGARVIAVEPFSANLRLLRSNIARNGVQALVTVVPAALGAALGVADLELSTDNQGDHRMSASPTGSVERVQCSTIDELCNGEVPAVIKLDTQGSEVRILRGGMDTCRPDAVVNTSFVIEYWPHGLAYCGSSSEELIGLLAPYVPASHLCFEIDERSRVLRGLTLADLANMARAGDYTPAAGGHMNLLIVPYQNLSRVADLIGEGEAGSADAAPFAPARYECSVYSQNGEDGVIAELARRTGCPKTMVEFGAGDGTECNSKFPSESGWTVAAFDGDPGSSSWVQRAFVTAENAVELVQSATLDDELGVLSIDLDGNDYWVLRQLLMVIRPQIVVAEYNATLGPVDALTVRYRPQRRWDHTNYFGASLAALATLGGSTGYSLVGCDSAGVNAFFVQTQQLKAAGLRPMPVASAYMPPTYGRVGPTGEHLGHDVSVRRFVVVESDLDAERAYRPWVRSVWSRPFRLAVEALRTCDAWRYGRRWLSNVRLRPARVPAK
jgi:FkbM family methyltransferase